MKLRINLLKQAIKCLLFYIFYSIYSKGHNLNLMNKVRKLINEVFEETWDRLESLGHAIGHDKVLDEFVKYFDDDTVNKAIDSIAQDWDVEIEGGSEEEEIQEPEQKPANPSPFETLAGAPVGLNENDGIDGGIVGLDILNHFPFTDLGETRQEYTRDVPGWGTVHIPSLDTGDAMSTVPSKDDIRGSEPWVHPKTKAGRNNLV